eukprot:CAMPEP_0116045128 /NCGR_PEP_ID=MMETSP0321-20121206/27419_1 /TAXON_ID=163516 /ORGANISM="Leptocylindrus danicus var. danicus, Strain B650" /LENGTH=947 /DNA_ID=CAMNT_0003526373 /DNA_START=107 /DNA_END=2947 /DNA_ORIENTATION=-
MTSTQEEFNLFRLAVSPIRDYQGLQHQRSSNRILSRLVEAERRAREKQASDLQRMREKEIRAFDRKTEAEQRLVRRLEEHHMHVDRVLEKVKYEENTKLHRSRKRMHSDEVTDVDATNDNSYSTSKQTKERNIRAAAQRGLLANQRRLRSGRRREKYHRAQLNRKEKLDCRRIKCRSKLTRAQEVAKCVRAARVIQHAVREHLLQRPLICRGVYHTRSGTMLASKSTVKIQRWSGWGRAVALRLYTSGSSNGFPRAAISRILQGFVNKTANGTFDFSRSTFDGCRKVLEHPQTIHDAAVFLPVLKPLLPNGINIHPRTFLSIFFISLHPNEVLGADLHQVHSKVVHRKSQIALKELVRLNLASTDDLSLVLRSVANAVQAFSITFEAWRQRDLHQMTKEMVECAEKTWKIYFREKNTLILIDDLSKQYCYKSAPISELRSRSGPSDFVVDDPLASIRLTHQAEFEGAKKYLQRIRKHLNSIVGVENGRALMKGAKSKSLEFDNVVSTDDRDAILSCIMQSNEHEVDEKECQQAANLAVEEKESDTFKRYDFMDSTTLDNPVAANVLSNEKLVHNIILTDEDESHLITFDGNPRLPNIHALDFFCKWKSDEEDVDDSKSKSMEVQVAGAARRAFFDRIIECLRNTPSSIQEFQNLVEELNHAIHALIPNRPDLHAVLEDSMPSSATDGSNLLLGPLVRAGKALHDLESPDRSSTTLDWINMTHSCISNRVTATFPHGLDVCSYAVASTAFLLAKTEQCRMDIVNSDLLLVAPYIRSIGHEYEKTKFGEKYDLKDSMECVPATKQWLERVIMGVDDVSLRVPSPENCLVVAGLGLVNDLLFNTYATALPEVFSFDAERLAEIKMTARTAVIGSALALHACNVSGVGVGALSYEVVAETNEKRRLVDVLTQKYDSQESMVEQVTDAVIALSSGKYVVRVGTLRSTLLFFW